MDEQDQPSAESVQDGEGVVIARSYQIAGAREVVGLLRSRGIPARTGSGGLATYIWVGEDVTSPLNFVEVPASRKDEALDILCEAEELDVVIVDDDEAGDESPAMEDSEVTDDPEVIKLPESTVCVNRALRAALISWIFAPISVVAYWHLWKATCLGTRQRDAGRATAAAALAAIPAMVLFSLIAILIIALANDSSMQQGQMWYVEDPASYPHDEGK